MVIDESSETQEYSEAETVVAESREDSETESQEAETDEAENRRLTGTKAKIDEEKPVEVFKYF